MIDHHAEYEFASAAATRLKAEGFGNATIAIQTGSGIPIPKLTDGRRLPWSEINGLPRPTAPGHSGALHHGLIHGVPVLVVEGRLHAYEGHEPAHVIRPIRALGLLGVRTAILTNAAGGVRATLNAGDLVHVTDHMNLMGFDALSGIHDIRFGDRFVALAGRTHDRRLGQIAHDAAAALGIPLSKGVYGGLHGPTFETEAQVAFLRTAGVDVCGMSTVPELAAAAQLGMRTLVLSLVTNAAGKVMEGLTAELEVLGEGQRSGTKLARLIEEIVGRMGPKAPR